jgi:hypothetical protein
MKRRNRRLWPFTLAGLGLISVPAVVCGLFGNWGEPEGSVKLARKWKAELSQYRTPDEAVARNQDVFVRRFDNGEWLIGRCRNSHGLWAIGGGTVVVKDSTGQVRAFFGHVCGDKIPSNEDWECSDLASFYRVILSHRFRACPLP